MMNVFRGVTVSIKQHREEMIGLLLMVLLGFGLLFGDGKQGLIEVYGVISTLFLWFFRLYIVKRGVRTLPSLLTWAWAGVIGAVGVSTAFSIDIGYSISWIIRLLSGYVLFRLFFDCSSEKMWAVVANGLLIFTGFASAISLLWIFPWFQRLIPSMSLIGMQYGHNHLADLLVLITPLLYAKLRPLSFKKAGVFFSIFWLGVVVTRARAAWIILLVYSVLYGLRTLSGQRRIVFLSLLSVVVIGCGIYATHLSITRPSSIQVRLGYWSQALDGFRARPLFGNGPGTFSLVSDRYQRFDQEASWFTHNQLLETLSELGSVGTLALALFFGTILWTWQKHQRTISHDSMLRPFFMGTVLIIVYGLFEYVLDYFIVWLLVWTLLGLISGALFVSSDEAPNAPPWGAMACILVFYVLWILGNGVGLLMHRSDISFLLAPFDAPLTLLYVSDTTLPRSPKLLTLATVFHRKNPEILYEMSKYYGATGNKQNAKSLMNMAVIQNPQNMTYLMGYLSLLPPEDPEQAGADILDVLSVGLPKQFVPRVQDLVPYQRHIGQIVETANTTKPFILQERYASLLYDIGLNALPDEPVLTKTLWELARDVYPDLSSLHIELARYYLHVDHSEEKARAVLSECTRYSSPRQQCEQFLRTNLSEFDLLPPGDYSDVLN